MRPGSALRRPPPLGLPQHAVTCAALACLTVTAACSKEPAPETLTVFAASSLREAFTELGARFETAHQVEVRFNFAGSQTLSAQLEHGAEADVFAAADLYSLEPLTHAGRLDRAQLFARNTLVLVVPRQTPNGAQINRFEQLPAAKRIVLGAAEVPVGRYTEALLSRARTRMGKNFVEQVLARVVSRELSVRQVLAKVRLGEADAGIVYQSDAVTAQDSVLAVALPAELAVVADYAIATIKDSPRKPRADAFLQLILSTHGRDVLQGAGFMPIGAGHFAPEAPP